MDEFDRVVQMFKKREGWKLYEVNVQDTSMTLLPTEQDRPRHQAEKRIGLDFLAPDGKTYNSVIIRISADDSGLNVLGFEEQND
jgi:hypothetical protein